MEWKQLEFRKVPDKLSVESKIKDIRKAAEIPEIPKQNPKKWKNFIT
jgi:hypothetical protein